MKASYATRVTMAWFGLTAFAALASFLTLSPVRAQSAHGASGSTVDWKPAPSAEDDLQPPQTFGAFTIRVPNGYVPQTPISTSTRETDYRWRAATPMPGRTGIVLVEVINIPSEDAQTPLTIVAQKLMDKHRQGMEKDGLHNIVLSSLQHGKVAGMDACRYYTRGIKTINGEDLTDHEILYLIRSGNWLVYAAAGDAGGETYYTLPILEATCLSIRSVGG